MQDKITIADAPDCLNTNDKAMWVLGYQAALEARSTCLHQIQEPAAAEQAAWHADLDEGRAQVTGSVSNATSQAAPAAVAVHMAEAWELSAADTEQRTTGAAQDYNQGVAEGLRICAKDLRAALAVTPAADEPMVNMTPPATRRDRWMYEQGRLAERDARTHGNAAAAAPVVLPEPDGYIMDSLPGGKLEYRRGQLSQTYAICCSTAPVFEYDTVRALLAAAAGLPALAAQCSVCGIAGIHACTGAPIPPMLPHEREKLAGVMRDIFQTPSPQAHAAPAFCHVALLKLRDLQERGYQITGYALEKPVEGAQPERGFINHGGFVGWWWDGQSPLVQPGALDAVTQAVRDYYFALDTRQHGGAAASTALDAIQKAFGLSWVQGAEASARAAQAAQGGE